MSEAEPGYAPALVHPEVVPCGGPSESRAAKRKRRLKRTAILQSKALSSGLSALVGCAGVAGECNFSGVSSLTDTWWITQFASLDSKLDVLLGAIGSPRQNHVSGVAWSPTGLVFLDHAPLHTRKTAPGGVKDTSLFPFRADAPEFCPEIIKENSSVNDSSANDSSANDSDNNENHVGDDNTNDNDNDNDVDARIADARLAEFAECTLEDLAAAVQTVDYIKCTNIIHAVPSLRRNLEDVFPHVLNGLDIRARELTQDLELKRGPLRNTEEQLAKLRRRASQACEDPFRRRESAILLKEVENMQANLELQKQELEAELSPTRELIHRMQLKRTLLNRILEPILVYDVETVSSLQRQLQLIERNERPA